MDTEHTLDKDSEPRNFCILQNMMHFLMQPGDATVYRFSFCRYPLTRGLTPYGTDAYILESGLGNAPEEYVYLAINQPGRVGLGCIMLQQLEEFPLNAGYWLGYLEGHGFGQVHPYTLIAVLLALKVLVNTPQDLGAAARAMLNAQSVLYEVQERYR